MLADEDLPGPLRTLSMHARKGLNEGYVKMSKRVFDNAKVSDHFAIIPTLQAPRSLSEIEAKLYDMVVKRFLAVFYPPAEFMVTTRISTVQAAGKAFSFQTNGKVMVKPGWLAVYGREAQEDDANLVAVAPGEIVRTENVDVNALKTKPPARYTEATLLSAMEDQKRVHTAVREREARYAVMVNSISDAIVSADSAGQIIAWNPGAERIFGYPAREILGQSTYELEVAGDLAALPASLAAVEPTLAITTAGEPDPAGFRRLTLTTERAEELGEPLLRTLGVTDPAAVQSISFAVAFAAIILARVGGGLG